jgi:hypothetical protein
MEFDRAALRQHIAHGWWKSVGYAEHECVGDQPYYCLYTATRELFGKGPVPSAASDLYMDIAQVVKQRFPHRIKRAIVHSYDARICLVEFNDHPETTQADVLAVIDGLT